MGGLAGGTNSELLFDWFRTAICLFKPVLLFV